MPLDVNQLLKDMLGAAKEPLKDSWAQIKDIATSEFKKLSQNLVDIEKMKLAGTITKEKATLQIEFQKNVLKTVLLTEKGVGLVAVEQSINAALNVISGVVDKAIGWKLL